MGQRLHEEEAMTTRKKVKYVHEGEYVAEVDVNVITTDDAWSPYLSVQDAYKLDDVRDALRRSDIAAASRIARVYIKKPVAV
jgi:hypothetical protein